MTLYSNETKRHHQAKHLLYSLNTLPETLNQDASRPLLALAPAPYDGAPNNLSRRRHFLRPTVRL